MATVKSKMNRTKTIALLGLMLSLTVIFCFVPIQFGPITLALMILPTLIVAQVCGAWTSLIMGVLMGLLNLIAWYTTKAASPIAPIFQNPLICLVPRILIAVVAYWSRRGLEALIIKKWMKINPTPDEVVEEDDEDNDEDVICGEVVEENVVTDTTPEIAETNVENDILDGQNADCEETTENEDVVLDTENIEEIKKQEKAKKAKEIAVRQVIHLISTALGVITNTLFVAIFTMIFFGGKTLGGTIINMEYILAWFGLNFGIEVVAFSLITPPITLAIKAAKLA